MSGSRATPGRSRLAEVLTIRAVGVDEQHGDRHRADPARDGGQGLRDPLDAGLVDVAGELAGLRVAGDADVDHDRAGLDMLTRDRKSTRLNSSHMSISYAVFCLKKKKNEIELAFTGNKKKKRL